MNHTDASGLVLAIHPTSRGFGWVLFEGDLVPVDWGIASAKENRSAKCMARFQKLLDQYHPSALILEKFEEDDSRRNDRIRTLVQTMLGFANNRDMDVLVYSREEIGTALTGNIKATRHEIALAVAEQMPFLQSRLPKSRKLWESEDWRQCQFDAAALGITHYDLTRPRS